MDIQNEQKLMKRDAGNPKWIRNAEITESIRLVQNQWCRDNGYAIRGKYRPKCVQNKAKRHLES